MPEVGVVGEGADDLVSPVLAGVIAVELGVFVVLEFMIDA